ncbi:MAG: recombinase [Microcystaceae cyanobacterium]
MKIMDEYEQYEADCEKIRQANEKLLSEFEDWLKTSGLSPKTIKNHWSNVEFYINEYLLYEDIIEAKDGIDGVSLFFGYWFIKKATWSSASSIKSHAASLKKFYTFMQEKGLVTKDNLNLLKETIKDEMDEWLDTLARYDDPSIDDMSEVWGY